MESTSTPLYTSKPTRKSIGNVYFIYADKIELRCKFLFITKTNRIQVSGIVTELLNLGRFFLCMQYRFH